MDETGIQLFPVVVFRYIGAELLDAATLDSEIQRVYNNWDWQ
jgi:hypothetical protein